MDKLIQIIEEMDIPFAYDHFAEGESPEPPFICYLIPGTDNFAADGRVYYKTNEVRIELYTDRKDIFFMRNPKYGLNQKSCMKSCFLLK